jgi:tetratricopeptide (TPR) repeat protein
MTSFLDSEMPGRPREHELEDESLRALRDLLPVAWTMEVVQRDYGKDVRIEIAHNGRMTALAFWVQLKATDTVNVKGSLSVSFANTTLNYLSRQADPVLLVRFHAPSGRLFGTWLHRHDLRLKRSGQKSLSLRWKLADEMTAASIVSLLEEVHRVRRIGEKAQLPLTVSLQMAGGAEEIKTSVMPLVDELIKAARVPLKLVYEDGADLRVLVGGRKLEVDTPLATLLAESEVTLDPIETADNVAIVLSLGLSVVGLPSPAVDLILRSTAAPLLRNKDVAGRIASAFAASKRVSDASDLALHCQSGRPGREALGQLLTTYVLMDDQDLSSSDARRIADNYVHLAERQQASNKNAGAAWYSAGNYLFHALGDYQAALDAYRKAAEARPDYQDQDYWQQETAAAMFETGDFAGAAQLYQESARGLQDPPPRLLATTADCLAHSGDTAGAIVLLDQYIETETSPEPAWLLKRLALQSLDYTPAPQQAGPLLTEDGARESPEQVAKDRPEGLTHGDTAEAADGDAGGLKNLAGLVHTGLQVEAALTQFVQAADHGDAASALAVFTLACAFPGEGMVEPWAALLQTARLLREEYAEWTLPGEVFAAALDVAIHRKGTNLVRDLLATGSRFLPPELVQEVKERVDELAASRTRTVLVRAVNEDGSREVIKIGLRPGEGLDQP